MIIIRDADARRSETPNAVMTTLASPTQGGAEHAIWRVDMQPGRAGPAHTFDVEQIYTVLDGSATIEYDGMTARLAVGDTAVLPADAQRQITADPQAGVVAIVAAPPAARASLADGTDKGTPPWAA